MSGRKAAVVWVCVLLVFTAVSLSGGVGIGGSTAAVDAEFQVTDAEFNVTDAEIEADENTIVEGESATITATVENAGNQTGTFTAELEAEADGVINTTDVEVGPGETREVSFTEPFETAGTYRLSVNGVSAGTLTVTEPSSPEFNVTRVTLSETEVAVDDAVNVTAEIENTGDANGTYTADLVVNDTVEESKTLDVDAGETATVGFARTFETTGDYAIGVGDAPPRELAVVQPESANTSITDAELSGTRTEPGSPVTVTATAVNDGGAAGDVTAELRINGTTRDTQTRTLDAGEEATIEFAASVEETGTHEIAVSGEPAGTLTVLEPADVSIGETTLSREAAEVDESIELAIELQNAGEVAAERDVDVTFGDGTTVQRSADVPANGTTLTVDHTYDAAGEYTVAVDGETVGNVTVDEPQDDADSGGGDESGASGSSGSSDSPGSSGSADSSGSSGATGAASTDDPEPTVVRSDSEEAVTVEVDGVAGERYEVPVELAGPSASQPAVSVSSLAVDPAGERDAFEATIGRPTAEPSGRDSVPNGTALGYVAFDSTLDATDTSAATLGFAVDEAAIPDGSGPEDVEVLRYADGEWTTANVTHDVDGDAHTVTLPHATPVAVVAFEPGSVEVVESDVPADWVRDGYETTLRATVENPGDRPATRTLTVTMRGEPVAEREVSLEPGESATVEIAFEPPQGGPVSLEGEEAGSIEVLDEDDAAPTDSETDEEIPGFGAVAAVLALSVAALAARRRRP